VSDRPPEPDDDPDVRDLSALGALGSAYLDFARERVGYRAPGGRLVAVESRRGLFVLGRKRTSPPVPTRSTGRTRSRERRDGRSRRSSDSPPGESDDPDPALVAGQVIKQRLAELGLTYVKVCELTGGVVSTATLSRLVHGTVANPYTRTKASLASALKMHVSSIWPV